MLEVTDNSGKAHGLGCYGSETMTKFNLSDEVEVVFNHRQVCDGTLFDFLDCYKIIDIRKV